jgi:DNA-binding protein HU-beta
MTKKSLIESIAMQMGCSQSEALRFIKTYQAIMIENLSHGGEFSLPGIGSLKRKTRAARTGRNPRTGESIAIPDKQIIHFQATAPLIRTLNQD